ncbi:hypothetical protein C0991_011016, partial [Blastosporella zonata]
MPIFSLTVQRDTVPHDLRHDLEALFWCITYVCITREGPGGSRRQELRPKNVKFPVGNSGESIADEDLDDVEDKRLLRLVNYCFFSTDDMGILSHNKSQLFLSDDYETHIMPHFHPYFNPFKDLMLQ